MTRFIYLLFFLNSIILFGQESYTFINKGVEIVFELNESETFVNEKISITNNSNRIIFVPLLDIENRFFYQTGNLLNSSNSIKYTILGPFPLHGSIPLKKIPLGESYSFDRQIELDNSICEYFFAFDFISEKDVKNKIKHKNGKYQILVIEFFNICHTFSSKIKSKCDNKSSN